MLPRAFIIGAMRSGTSALARQVSAHPDLYLAPNKEVHFWDAYYERGLDWYESLFGGMDGEHIACDASPFMYDHEAIDRLATYVPDARLVAIIRNPVDRSYSHYWHNRRRDREDLPFDQAMFAENARTTLSGAGPARRRMRRPDDVRYQFLYWERSRYAKHLAHVTDAFPREQVLVVRNEELRHDMATTIERVLEHFELDPERYRRSQGNARSSRRRIQQLLRRPSGRRRSLDSTYPPLDATIRVRLVHKMEPEIAHLEAWLGRSLPESWRT